MEGVKLTLQMWQGYSAAIVVTKASIWRCSAASGASEMCSAKVCNSIHALEPSSSVFAGQPTSTWGEVGVVLREVEERTSDTACAGMEAVPLDRAPIMAWLRLLKVLRQAGTSQSGIFPLFGEVEEPVTGLQVECWRMHPKVATAPHDRRSARTDAPLENIKGRYCTGTNYAKIENYYVLNYYFHMGFLI